MEPTSLNIRMAIYLPGTGCGTATARGGGCSTGTDAGTRLDAVFFTGGAGRWEKIVGTASLVRQRLP